MQESWQQPLTSLTGPTENFCIHLQIGPLGISGLQSEMGPHGFSQHILTICIWAFTVTLIYTYHMGSSLSAVSMYCTVLKVVGPYPLLFPPFSHLCLIAKNIIYHLL